MQHPFLSDPPARPPDAEEAAVAQAWVEGQAGALRRSVAVWLPPLTAGAALLAWSAPAGGRALMGLLVAPFLVGAWVSGLRVTPGAAGVRLGGHDLRAAAGALWVQPGRSPRPLAVAVPAHWPPLDGPVKALVVVPARADGRPLHGSLSVPLAVWVRGVSRRRWVTYSLGEDVRSGAVRPGDVVFRSAG